MSTSGKLPSRVVFIGNIPFDLTEEQIMDIFKEVGPIQNFRLMFDKETGKPRGFAFCEYADIETANSAIRNLNGFDISGRTLKVDYADSEVPTHPTGTREAPSGGGGGGGGPSYGHHASPGREPAPLPPLQIQATYATSLEAINATLASLTNAQLTELVTQTKALAVANPEQARLLLQSNPQLTFALLQAMLLTNMVEPRIIQQIMQSQHKPPTLATPSTSNAGGGNAREAEKAAPDQQEVIRQIMSLSEEQIRVLPPEQQAQIRAFRAQYK